jgi:hypothetical protein
MMAHWLLLTFVASVAGAPGGTNTAAGNFYTAEKLTPPLDASVEKDGIRVNEDGEVRRGSCNSCHTLPPVEHTQGRLYWSAS